MTAVCSVKINCFDITILPDRPPFFNKLAPAAKFDIKAGFCIVLPQMVSGTQKIFTIPSYSSDQKPAIVFFQLDNTVIISEKCDVLI